MSEFHSEVKELQTKTLVPTRTQIHSASGSRNYEEAKIGSDSINQETLDYITAKELQDEEIKNAEFLQGDKNSSEFSTKLSTNFPKNSTQGWVVYATENSNFPPRIQYI